MTPTIRLNNDCLGSPMVEELKLLRVTYTDNHPQIVAMKEELQWHVKHELMFDRLKEKYPEIYRELLDWFMTVDEVYET